MEQIRRESNSENIRKELIEKANQLAKNIISYRNERHSPRVTSDNNQAKKRTTLCCCAKRFYTQSSANPSNSQGNNGTELTHIRIEGDSPANGPPPPPSRPSSLVDEALEAFIRDLQSETSE